MAKDPEEAGQPASGKPADSGAASESAAVPVSKQPAEAAPTDPHPIPAAGTPPHAEPAAGVEGDAAMDAASSGPGEVPEAVDPTHTAETPEAHQDHSSHDAAHSSHGTTEDSSHHDLAQEAYSEYQHQDDPYHHDSHHSDSYGHDSHHHSGADSTGDQPHGDYYHEPGAYDSGSAAAKEGSEPEGERGFDGLFGSEDDTEGGPVKSFLDHLEDLRWVIIKCIASVLVAMVVCLVATPAIVWAIKWPLLNPLFNHANLEKPVIRLQISTNQVEFEIPTNMWGPIPVATNQVTTFELVPVTVGTNVILALQLVPDAPKDPRLKIPLINVKSVSASFSIAVQIALWGGVGLAAPIVMLFIGQFLVPALKQKERKYLYRGVGIGGGLFLAGVLFCYFVVMRVAILATVDFATWMGFASEIWDAEEYITFCVKFMVGMGLCFQVPVLILTLVKIGLLDYRKLNKFRPFWIIGNLILSGFVTPDGNPFTMILMAAPIHLLYEISVIIAWWWDRQDRKREAAEKKASE